MPRNDDINPADRSGQDNENKNMRNQDLQDSSRDQQRLKPEEGSIDLPDVKDIPGQEFIHVPRMGEMADTTISSDDEEGTGLFDDDQEDNTLIRMGTENDVAKEDRVALRDSDNIQGLEDDGGLNRASLDESDNEGEALNESFDRSGKDLDVPGAEEDDRDESVGEEDEENNPYSLGSDSNDNMTEGTP